MGSLGSQTLRVRQIFSDLDGPVVVADVEAFGPIGVLEHAGLDVLGASR